MILKIKGIGENRAMIVNFLGWFLVIMGIPYVVLFLHFDLFKSASIMGGLYTIAVSSLLLNKYHHENIAKVVLVGGLSLILLAYSLLLGKDTGAPLIFFPIISLPLILFDPSKKKSIAATCCIPVICRFLFDYLDYTSPHWLTFFHENIGPVSQLIIYEFAVFTAFLFTFTFVYFFYLYEQRFKQERQEKLVQEKEIQLARKIQEKLLPKTYPKIEGLSISAMSQPARNVSGDFYDIRRVNDHCVDIIIADIVGKGLPACLHMVTLKSILSSVYSKDSRPAEIMTLLNRALLKDPVFDKFLPTIICRIDTLSRECTYCSAGMDQALLIQNRTLHVLENPNSVLGLDDDVFVENSVSFSEGDCLYLYTDGLTEASNDQGDMFVTQFDPIFTHAPSINELHRNVMSFTNNRELQDDLTILRVSF